ncbi:MAG: hypothetical protein J0L87_11560 [Bacteroidetes bacterium]|nr:hypothetical protein [Bacteroidota bacterium]
MYKKKYKIRHKILEVLQKHQDYVYSLTKPPEQLYQFELALDVEQISSLTKYSEIEVVSEIEILLDRNQISQVVEEFKDYYFINKVGSVVYYDKYYLEEGKKNLISIVKDYITIITAIGLFLIAVYTFISNIIQTHTNTKDLDAIKSKLNTIEKKLK